MAEQPFGTCAGRPEAVAYREVRHDHRATPLSGRGAHLFASSRPGGEMLPGSVGERWAAARNTETGAVAGRNAGVHEGDGRTPRGPDRPRTRPGAPSRPRIQRAGGETESSRLRVFAVRQARAALSPAAQRRYRKREAGVRRIPLCQPSLPVGPSDQDRRTPNGV